MAEAPQTPDDTKPDKGEAEASAAGAVPPKRLGWPWTILLLLTLPAVGLGLWYGGTRHRVDDHPKKVKRRPRRLVPKQQVPGAAPARTPPVAPARTPPATSAMTPPATPAMAPPATPDMAPPPATPDMAPPAAPQGGMK